jgi:hypothetical protein
MQERRPLSQTRQNYEMMISIEATSVMHSTMRAYDSLVLETTHGCIGRIAQRSRNGGSENRLTQASDAIN